MVEVEDLYEVLRVLLKHLFLLEHRPLAMRRDNDLCIKYTAQHAVDM